MAFDAASVSSAGSDAAIGVSTKRKNRTAKSKQRRKGKLLHQRFSDYIVFGLHNTVCLLVFVACYALLLVTLWPLLQARAPEASFRENVQESGDAGTTPRQYLKRMMHVPPALQEAHLPGQDKLSAAATGLRQRIQQFRQGRGVTDANLLDQTKVEFEERRKKREGAAAAAAAKLVQDESPNVVVAAGAGSDHRTGFVVLGMHRSGTSMLSGLLHMSAGYTVGGPLIGGAFDNEKGFFERVDVVLQNDEFMRKQRISWASNVINYDWEQALKDKQSGAVTFEKGQTGLKFLNDPANAPWLQKDPRMCITLKTWLKLLQHEPAVVFTYRNPLEVAMSLKKREKNFTLEHGLRLWIVYNMRAIQNSNGLCVVRSSNDAILADPLHEIQRISDELTTTCGVPAPPSTISQEDVDKFIDPQLQHNRKEREEEDKEVLETYNNGACKVYSYISEFDESSSAYKREHQLYQKAMKVFCDFQSGAAYKDDYIWPELP